MGLRPEWDRGALTRSAHRLGPDGASLACAAMVNAHQSRDIGEGLPNSGWPTVNAALHNENIQKIAALERAALQQRSLADRVSTAITRFTG